MISGWKGTSGRCYELWEERRIRAGDAAAADFAMAASALELCGIAVADDADDEPVADLEYPGGPHLGGNVGRLAIRRAFE